MTPPTPEAQRGRELIAKVVFDGSWIYEQHERDALAAFLAHVDQLVEDLRKAEESLAAERTRTLMRSTVRGFKAGAKHQEKLEQQIAALTEAAREYRKLARIYLLGHGFSDASDALDAALAKAGIVL